MKSDNFSCYTHKPSSIVINIDKPVPTATNVDKPESKHINQDQYDLIQSFFSFTKN